MPGSVESIGPAAVLGWALHPWHRHYPMVVHALVQGRVIASGLAVLARPDGRRGFVLPLKEQDPAQVRVMLGETGEYLPHAAQRRSPGAPWTVEQLVAVEVARPWVNGACHIEAEQAGLLTETIIDLLCRDYLGRVAGPVVIGGAMTLLHAGGGFAAVRRNFLESSAYQHRRVYADQAPGAIFSQPMVMQVAARDFVTEAQRAAKVIVVSAAALLDLRGADFITACYRQILRKEPDREGMVHYTRRMAAGLSRAGMVRHLAGEFEAVNAGVMVIDIPPD